MDEVDSPPPALIEGEGEGEDEDPFAGMGGGGDESLPTLADGPDPASAQHAATAPAPPAHSTQGRSPQAKRSEGQSQRAASAQRTWSQAGTMQTSSPQAASTRGGSFSLPQRRPATSPLRKTTGAADRGKLPRGTGPPSKAEVAAAHLQAQRRSQELVQARRRRLRQAPPTVLLSPNTLATFNAAASWAEGAGREEGVPSLEQSFRHVAGDAGARMLQQLPPVPPLGERGCAEGADAEPMVEGLLRVTAPPLRQRR